MRERVVGTNAITLSKTCDYIQFGSFKFRLREKNGIDATNLLASAFGLDSCSKCASTV